MTIIDSKQLTDDDLRRLGPNITAEIRDDRRPRRPDRPVRPWPVSPPQPARKEVTA
jgi:hypothetical protein